MTRAQWVDQQLRAAILTGEVRPGEKLNTEELARRWSVSPTPLRETYQRLAAEGLVELVPQRGARVAAASLDDALDIYGVRLVLEPHALRLSLAHATDEWRRAVADAFEPLRAELESPDDILSLEAAHRDFHLTLLSRCGSSWLLRIIRMLQDHSVRYRLLSLEPRGGPIEVLHEHEELVESCLSGDIEAASRRLAAHIQLTVDSIADQIDNATSTTSDEEHAEEVSS